MQRVQTPLDEKIIDRLNKAAVKFKRQSKDYRAGAGRVAAVIITNVVQSDRINEFLSPQVSEPRAKKVRAA